jgi:hypothetical protein
MDHGLTLGADLVKTAYSGSPEAFARVVEPTRLPVVAGGSKGTDEETLEMVRGAMDAGAAGVSMGRSRSDGAGPAHGWLRLHSDGEHRQVRERRPLLAAAGVVRQLSERGPRHRLVVVSESLQDERVEGG